MLPSRLGEPNLILLVLGEQLVVNSNFLTCGTERVRDDAATPLPMPFSIQEIRISASKEYLDFVYFCNVLSGELSLDYRAARAYHWFSNDDLGRFPLLPHVLAYASRALDELSRGNIQGDMRKAPVTGR